MAWLVRTNGGFRIAARALVIAASLASAERARAQDTRTVAGSDAARVSVGAAANGSLSVKAKDAPLDEVIRAVASSAGIQVSILGDPPRDRVTVAFSGAPAERILWDLMGPAGISYVMTPEAAGRPARLLMGVLTPGSDAKRTSVSNASLLTVVPPPQTEPAQEVATADASPASTEPEASDPNEWPSGVQPVNAGATVALPDSRDALLQMVNGGAPVSFPSGVTPNPGGPRTPDQLGPVNPINPGLGTSAQPGMLTGNALTPPVPVKIPDNEVPPVPQTFKIPAPVVVFFPPPPTP